VLRHIALAAEIRIVPQADPGIKFREHSASEKRQSIRRVWSFACSRVRRHKLWSGVGARNLKMEAF